VHPYRWPTIGEKLADIEGYTTEAIWDFYQSHYHPGNAILVVAGDVTKKQVEALAKKWFGPIPGKTSTSKVMIPQEPLQQAKRSTEVLAKVPTDALYKAYKMPAKGAPGYLEADLISDLLGLGKSAPLEQRLVKNGKIFASIGAYITGSVDPGLLVFSGKMEQGVSAKVAEEALDGVLNDFLKQEISETSLQKIKNQGEAMKSYESIQLLNRAMNLAYYAHLGDPGVYWREFEQKASCPAEQISSWATQLLQEEQASVVYYQSTRA
jgi:predicted Zn-dependent peptidase